MRRQGLDPHLSFSKNSELTLWLHTASYTKQRHADCKRQGWASCLQVTAQSLQGQQSPNAFQPPHRSLLIQQELSITQDLRNATFHHMATLLSAHQTASSCDSSTDVQWSCNFNRRKRDMRRAAVLSLAVLLTGTLISSCTSSFELGQSVLSP